jgi:hypothetical protein
MGKIERRLKVLGEIMMMMLMMIILMTYLEKTNFRHFLIHPVYVIPVQYGGGGRVRR